jgi:hypothetical protein
MPEAERGSLDRAATVLVAAFGTLMVTVYAVFGVVQILVLNPLAAVPDKQLDQIWADLAAANESWTDVDPVMVLVLGVGVGAAVLLLVLIVPRRDATPLAAALAYLAVLIFGAPAYWIASFGTTLNLADTYMISGGEYSPWSTVLYAVSGLAIVATAAIGAIVAIRRRRIARRGAISSVSPGP